jgi:hypothetical protein
VFRFWNNIFGSYFTKRNFGTRDGKPIFGAKKMKISFCKVVHHSEVQVCAQYELLHTNYALVRSISLEVMHLCTW